MPSVRTCAAAVALVLALAAPRARAQDLDQAPRAQKPPEPPRTPQLTKPPKLLSKVDPVYPPGAWDAGLTADVTLTVDIDAEGKPSRVDVPRPVGNGFDEAAKAAVMQFRFSPAEIDGKPAAIRIEYTLHFFKAAAPEAPDGGSPDAAPPEPPPPPPPPPDVVLAVGRLREKGTRDPLREAEVAVILRAADGSAKPAVVVGATDAEGRFEVKGQPGAAMRVIVTEANHDPCIRDFLPGKLRPESPTEIDCQVRRRLGGIYETRVKAPPPTQAVTRYELKQPELTSVPGTFGDPLRVVQNLPGVARTPFGLGGLIIRGANPNDSGIYVEGHKIPILYHFLGGPSVLTPRLIDRLDFFPGNFGVKYGRVTAGIIDVGIKTEPTPRLHGAVDINLLDSSAYVEGPLAKGWSGSLSARRSYIDLLLPFVLPTSTVSVAPVYYDYQAIVHRDLGVGRLSLFAFGSNDTLKVIAKDPSTGNLDLGTETGFHKVFALWLASGGGWVNRFSPGYGYERQRLTAGTVTVNQAANVFELRDELSRALTSKLAFRAGFDGEIRRDSLFFDVPTLIPETRIYGDILPTAARQQITIPLDTMAGGLYADLGIETGGGLTITPGIRGDAFRYVGQNRFTFDPRLVVRWKMLPSHVWKGGVGIYHQMPEPQLLNADAGNPNLPPIWADQYSLGFVHDITQKISLDTTFYYVRRHDLPLPPAPFTSGGKGRSYGMEVILKHDFTERFFGWIAYTLSRSEQTAYAVNAAMTMPPGGLDTGMNTTPRYFPTDFDQTHNLIVVASYKLRNWRLGIRYRLVSGAPDTPLFEGAFDADNATYACRAGPTNSTRKPLFQQLDFRMDRTWTFNSWELGVYADVQNVLNAENREFTIYDYRCRGSIPVRGIPTFPIIGLKGTF